MYGFIKPRRYTKWFFILPGYNEFYAYNTPDVHHNEQSAREWVRERYNLKRLPNHSAFWRM